MSLALMDSLICIEMPFFAIAHQYAFQASDYIDTSVIHVARLPFWYAARDAFGLKDVWEDIKYTFRARGVSYKAYEAADGGLHHNEGRQKRIRAGLRYAAGGKAKYWVPVPGESSERAPLLPQHLSSPRLDYDSSDSDASDATSLGFSSLSEGEDTMYARARRIGYAGYPNVDVSVEQARQRRREEEDGILSGKRTRRGTATRPSPAGPSGRERRSARNKRSTQAGARVYGAWADRVPSSSGTVEAVVEVDDAAFDGEVENSSSWAGDGSGSTALRFTHKTAKDGRPRPRPFVVQPEPPAPEPILNVVEVEPDRSRSDAVDLVSPTELELQKEASGRGKRRGGRSPAGQPSPLPRNDPPAARPPPRPTSAPAPAPREPSPPPPRREPSVSSVESSPPRSFRPRDSPPRAFGSYRAPSFRWAQPDDNPWA